MQLNIVDHETMYTHVAFGVSDQRRQEIMKGLDKIMAGYWNKGPFKLSDVMVRIGEICNTTEELVLAVYHNAEWMEQNKQITKLY